MPTVELIYDSDCPNAAETRAQLLRAFAETKLTPRWQEWRGGDVDSPAHVRGYGSPTILVGGNDIAGTEERSRACCRLYEQPDGSIRGVPSVEMLVSALKANDDAVGAHRSCARRPGSQTWGLDFAPKEP